MITESVVGNRLSKADFKATVPQLRVDLINAQYKLRKADFGVLLFVAGDDRVAANAVVNRINEWMDARYIRTVVMGRSTEEEAMRPRNWRVWRDLPPKGATTMMAGGIMRLLQENLSHHLSDSAYERAVDHLAELQTDLINDGMLIIKIYLHTPAEEQRRRIRKAKDDDDGWRVDTSDWQVLERLDENLPKVERLLRRTAVDGSPWTIVESTDTRYRDVAVGRTILSALTTRLAGRPAAPPSPPEVLSAPAESVTVLDAVDLERRTPKKTYERDLNMLQRDLHRLALKARRAGVPTVLAFEGWDAAGKGGAIRRITQALEAGDYRVISTAAPTHDELRYHYLWRFWRDLPRAGQFVLYDRTWYGRVLVERIEGFATEWEWQRAYGEINDFEDQLTEHGIVVAKFWLHISSDEQLARFQAREQTPEKVHKITDEDYRNREKWDDYVLAVDDMVRRTSSPDSPWHVIPANDKFTARLEVLEHVNAALRRALKGKG